MSPQRPSSAETLTLVDRAKAIPRMQHIPATPDQIDLALAWAHGELGFSQVAHVLGRNTHGNGLYIWLALALRQAVHDGQLTATTTSPERSPR